MYISGKQIKNVSQTLARLLGASDIVDVFLKASNFCPPPPPPPPPLPKLRLFSLTYLNCSKPNLTCRDTLKSYPITNIFNGIVISQIVLAIHLMLLKLYIGLRLIALPFDQNDEMIPCMWWQHALPFPNCHFYYLQICITYIHVELILKLYWLGSKVLGTPSPSFLNRYR